jgi:hypothetical protein
MVSVFLGSLFVAGYFCKPDEKLDLSSNGSELLGQTTLYSIASALLMIPLKIIISTFLVAKPLLPAATRSEIEGIEGKRGNMRKIGYILILVWLGACSWGITMFAVNFNEMALNKWLVTYFGALFWEVFIVFQLKVILKVLISFLLLKLLRLQCMLLIAGSIAGKVVDLLMQYL